MSAPKPAVAVIGTGTMGAGIAQLAAQHGHEVWLLDRAPELVESARARLAQTWEKLAQKGRMDEATREACVARLHAAAGFEDLGACGWAVEAIAEDLAAKRELFSALDRVLPGEAILASNTSSLGITALAGATKRPARFVGLHFFNPPALMALG